VATGFTQREPIPGAPATAQTEARVVYGRDAIYVAMRMYDPRPDSILSRLTRRDDASAVSDWAAVLIDSYNDRRTAFRFATTPRGVRVDALLSEDTREDLEWDAVWEVATRVDAEGWTAEFRIPLSQLRYTAGSDAPGVWGIQFMREVSRRSEVSYWSPVPPASGRMVSLFGELHGLETLASARRLEVLPYSLGRVRREPGAAGDPFHAPNALSAATGADLKYGVTSNFTLTATLNPDFGQVEADPSVVNLGTFETFYPERRPFFTEGSEIFRFSLVPEGHVFYSRRIGRPPQRVARAPAGGFADAPDASRILGAAKLSGKTPAGWSVGMLHATTGEAQARVADGGGDVWREPVEPLTNYTVLRVSRDLRRGQSGVGGITTSLFRDLSDDRLAGLRSQAFSTGANAWHRFGRGRYQATGWILGSHVRGAEPAIAALQRNNVHRFQRPDATHLDYDSTRTSLSGWAGEAYMAKIAGNWTWNVGGGARSPGVDVNDAGYQTYADVVYLAAIGGYRQFRPGPLFRSWSARGRVVPGWSFGGEPLRRMGDLVLTGQLNNLWGGSLTLERWLSAPSAFELRGGPLLQTPARTEAVLNLNTNRRQTLGAELRVSGAREDDGGRRTLSIGAPLYARPTPSTTVSVAPTVAWNDDPAQYVRTVRIAGAPYYLMGELDQRTVALTTRLGYAFSPTLSFDLYGQPFASAGTYRALRQVAEPRAPRFRDRFDDLAADRLALDPATGRYRFDPLRDGRSAVSFPDPSFNVRRFQANTVARWEYRPGSTLFLVWSHGRNNDLVEPGLRVGRELERLFEAEPRNVFLLKVSYWMGG
jgi:hypothetical protein